MIPPAAGPRRREGWLTSLLWALRFSWESGRGLTLASGVLTMFQSLVPLLGLYVMKLLIDAVAGGLTAADRAPVFTRVTWLIFAFGGVTLLERALGTVADLVKTIHAHLATDRVYRILHAKSVDVDLEYYEHPEYYDALHRAQQEAPYRPARILDGVFRFAQSAVSLVAIGALLLTFHWSVPVFLALAAAPSLLIRLRYARKLYLASRLQTPAERRALYFHAMLTGDGYAKEVRLFNLGGVFADRFERLRTQIRREKIDLVTRRSLADLAGQAGATIPVFLLYGVLAYRAVQGLLTIGELVMFYQAMQRGQSALNQLSTGIGDLYESQLFLSHVHEFLNLEPRVRDSASPVAMPEALRHGITFENVHFRYPNSTALVLEGVNLHIRPGEHIALVGENGCGKTTLVKLLARLYDPSDGRITVDGADLRDVPLAALRKSVAVVFQDYGKYNASARDNIWFGDVEASPDSPQVQAAAATAGLHDMVAALDKGYDTVLGKKFESGTELSMGQWQKVAVARAFFRDAEIVILDEPTSALDARAESEVFQKFHQLFQGRTAVLISHRLSTVKMADRIYFLEHGRIVESGSHHELIDRGGKYAVMFEMQARHYR